MSEFLCLCGNDNFSVDFYTGIMVRMKSLSTPLAVSVPASAKSTEAA